MLHIIVMEKIDLILQYSPWFVPLCLILGAVYAGILYYRERHNEFGKNIRYLLAALRFLAVSFLAFLLLSPLVKKQSHESEQPVVIFAQDFSASIVQTQDSAYYKSEYLDKLNGISEELSDKYKLDFIGFSEGVTADTSHDFKGQMTNMGSVLEYVKETYENRNLGALFIASDGIVNRGRDPYYESKNIDFPLHTIAMGDTTRKKDLKIAEVRNNDIAYKGNRFPVEMDLKAVNANGQIATLMAYRDNKKVEQKQMKIDSDNWQETVSMTFDAEEKGVQEFKIQVKALSGEENQTNNTQKVYIEVLENKQRILILAANPHPDVAAIRRAIDKNPNYETKVRMLSRFWEKVQAYNLVIMHNLPAGGRKSNKIMDRVETNKIPVWFVVGRKTNLNILNNYGSELNIRVKKNKFEEVKGQLNPRFTLFKIPEDKKGLLPALPPLEGPFGDYKSADESRILAYRQIGDVQTSAPLWAFAKDNQRKYGVTFGVGLWRWRIYNYLENNNHKFIDELIKKSVKYLVAKEDKSRFRLETKSRFAEYETVTFEAELYNESYELTNEPEVKLKIIDSEGKEYPYVMSRERDAYELSIDKLSPGSYRYNASVNLGNERYTRNGGFVVEEVNMETMNTVADHHLLHRLANEHNGRVLSPQQLNEIPGFLEEAELKPELYTVKEYVEWIQIRWLLFVIIGLLTIEWLVRKLNGAF